MQVAAQRFGALALAAAIGLGALAGASQARAGETLDRIRDRGALVMATDADYPPQSFLNAQNEYDGFDVDVGREIARRMGVDIEFATPGWHAIVSGRWDGRWDISVGSMTPTSARAQALAFPAIYYYTPASLVTHADNTTIVAVADAGGKRVGVGVSTTYEAYLRGDLTIDAADTPPFQYQIARAVVRPYDTDILALDALALGDGVALDAAVTALPTALEAIKAGAPIKVVGDPLFLEPLAIAIAPGDAAFFYLVKGVVEEMRDDGALSALSRKWYGADLTR